MDRGSARRRLLPALALAAAALLAGCDGAPAVTVIGRPGINGGEFDRPRGIAASEGRIAVVDMTGRLQRFRGDGTLEVEVPVMPEGSLRGFPLGVLLRPDGGVTVVHTHEAGLVTYSPEGRETKRFGNYGVRTDEFCMPQRAVPVEDGFLVTDFGYLPCRMVKHVSPDGALLGTLGGPDTDAVFARPMGIAVTPDGSGRPAVWVADTSHHLFVLREGVPSVVLGGEGDGVGRLRFPAGVAVHPDGGVVVCEAGNHRLQWFGPDGRSRGVFGRMGPAPGEFRGPYDCAVDGRWIWVADTDNHRVQGMDLDDVPWSMETP